jgi:hypothetical protein
MGLHTRVAYIGGPVCDHPTGIDLDEKTLQEGVALVKVVETLAEVVDQARRSQTDAAHDR